MSLSDSEFQYIIKLEKEFEESDGIKIGPAPIKWSRGIKSTDKKETFILDFHRGSFEVKKFTANNRYRQSIVLVRFDSLGIHTNPDIICDDGVTVAGITFNGPHFHIYKNGYGTSIAYPISTLGLKDNFDITEAIYKVLEYINIKKIPSIQSTL